MPRTKDDRFYVVAQFPPRRPNLLRKLCLHLCTSPVKGTGSPLGPKLLTSCSADYPTFWGRFLCQISAEILPKTGKNWVSAKNCFCRQFYFVEEIQGPAGSSVVVLPLEVFVNQCSVLAVLWIPVIGNLVLPGYITYDCDTVTADSNICYSLSWLDLQVE